MKQQTCRDCGKWTRPQDVKPKRHHFAKGQCQVTKNDIGGKAHACEEFKNK